jgi:predicted transcriptional regulator
MENSVSDTSDELRVLSARVEDIDQRLSAIERQLFELNEGCRRMLEEEERRRAARAIV